MKNIMDVIENEISIMSRTAEYLVQKKGEQTL